MTPDVRIDSARRDALALAGAVRERDYATVRVILHRRTTADPRDWYALAIVLAAAIPDDVPLDDLLAWATAWPEPVTAEAAAEHRADLAAALTPQHRKDNAA